jgi:cholesterol transport system auxiliary component
MTAGNRQRAIRRTTLMLAATGLLAACTGDGRGERVYRLPPPAQMVRLDDPALAGVLLVEQLSASAITLDRRIAYREEAEGLAVRFLEEDLWGEPPPALVQGQLRGCLASGGAARTIVPAGLAMRADYVLSGQLDRFEVLVSADGPQVSVGLDLFLTAEEPRRLLWQQRFDYEVGVSREGIPGVMRGFQAALAGLCRDVMTLIASGDSGGTAYRPSSTSKVSASGSITAR